MKKTTGLFFIIMLWAGTGAWAVPVAETGAPADLAAWQKWVLYGHEEQYLCPEAGDGRFRCAWPVSLELDMNEHGGRFSQTFELKKEGAFPLPGGPGAWPVEVTHQAGQPLAVLGRDRPRVWLPAGRYTLNGAFQWNRLPETIDLPLGFVLDLKVDGQPLDFPALEVDYNRGQTRLWLKSRIEETPTQETAGQADSLTVTVSRLIQDSQPMMIKSRFRLAVSGQAREVMLNQVLLPDTRATYLASPLPAQLTGQGLRVRVKPGIHEIILDSRSLGRAENLGPVAESAESPEYWAYQAQPQLRLAEVAGAPQIDASQADIYPPWRGMPVYLMEPGRSLTFSTIRRGDPEPPPDQLNLARECWLDYDGGGLSCRDRLTGTLNRQWHLNTSEPFVLAQASLAGAPQVITWQTDSQGRQAPGLQLRNGRVDLTADLRIDNFNGTLPASGWDHKLETGGQRLNLPPGYRLLHASGADVRQTFRYGGGAAGTWTGAWGTLDFFLILIITIAVWKLYGPGWAFLALPAMILCYHEPWAPRMVFLHLLACAALLRLLPDKGKARFLMRLWFFGAALALVVFTSMFMINQVRVTLYPQVENPNQRYNDRWDIARPQQYYGDYESRVYDDDIVMHKAQTLSVEEAAPMPETIQNAMSGMADMAMQQPAEPPRGRVKSSMPMAKPAPSPARGGDMYANRMVRLSQAPDAKVQNNAPRPAWNWRTVQLNYNSSVTADQEVSLYFITPLAGRILGLTRIALMSIFALMMLGAAAGFRLHRGGFGPLKAGAAALFLLSLAGPMAAPALAGDPAYPSREMLDTFRARLLEKKPVPEPGLPELAIYLDGEKLTMAFKVEANREAIVPLPTLDRDIFRPTRLALGNETELPLLEEKGQWLVLVPEGQFRLVLEGRLKKPSAAFQAFQINFPNSARPQKTVIRRSDGWRVEGIEPDGQLRGGGLYVAATDEVSPTDDEAAPEDESTSVTLSPFFLVQRTISLGLEWQVHTTVRRITPAGAPVSLKLPLLAGENPVSGDIRQENGQATLNFGPQVEELSWDSRLKISEKMTLTAGDGPWTESWSLDVSPIWRVTNEGLIPIHNTNNGFWQPQWRPWPGEKLTLAVDRPQPVPGQYLVVDRAGLSLTAGENNRLAGLVFLVRTSQGGPYSFRLPQGAEVREFKVDGRTVPLAPSLAEGGGEAAKTGGPLLTASLTSGEHEIEVSWLDDLPLGPVATTPLLDLGVPTANITVTQTLPEDRWIIWAWGPRQGPAVMFWPLLAVVLLAGYVLRRYTSPPLSWGAWFLLGIGLIQLDIFGAMIVAGWLLALDRRLNKPVSPSVFWFNAGQIILVVWTAAALALIYKGIEYGLLRNPDMLIEGGGSYGQYLSWFTDRAGGPWPKAGVLSVSVWFYKALMLAWSLWLAVSLVKWLRWGWQAFSSGSLWKKRPPRVKASGPEPNKTGQTSNYTTALNIDQSK